MIISLVLLIMSHRSLNRLRAHRTHWKLSGAELARLLGLRNASGVSRIEQGAREPTASLVVGCEVVFGIAADEMFPGFYDKVEDAALRRGADLSLGLEGKNDRASVRKRELLGEMIRRARTSDTRT